jgi:acyl-CoA synthetase (NDP forming)
MECITTLNEHEGSSMIRDWGIPVIDGMIADNEAEVETAARELGYPVALKVCSSAVMHKTDQGGVTLNICDASSLARSFREIQRRFVGTTHTYLVQKMARPGVELILGARRDPVFGPIVLVGIGGVFTEVFRDTALDLARSPPRMPCPC